MIDMTFYEENVARQKALVLKLKEFMVANNVTEEDLLTAAGQVYSEGGEQDVFYITTSAEYFASQFEENKTWEQIHNAFHMVCGRFARDLDDEIANELDDTVEETEEV